MAALPGPVGSAVPLPVPLAPTRGESLPGAAHSLVLRPVVMSVALNQEALARQAAPAETTGRAAPLWELVSRPSLALPMACSPASVVEVVPGAVEHTQPVDRAHREPERAGQAEAHMADWAQALAKHTALAQGRAVAQSESVIIPVLPADSFSGRMEQAAHKGHKGHREVAQLGQRLALLVFLAEPAERVGPVGGLPDTARIQPARLAGDATPGDMRDVGDVVPCLAEGRHTER